MAEPIKVYLSSEPKWRNGQEYRPVNVAECEGFKSVGDGANIVYVLNSIYEANKSQISRLVEVYRGDTLCFHPAPLKTWLSKYGGVLYTPKKKKKEEE